MKVLIADDDPVTCARLDESLNGWGYQVVAVHDGTSAALRLLAPNAPHLAIIDWLMPGINGPEVCRQIRATESATPPYLILLTARADKHDVVTGLRSGADDYMIKPCDDDELLARLRVGERILDLQKRLSDQVLELKNSLAHVKLLHGLLPICCYCKRIRDDHDYWQQVEAYISSHSEAHFSHTFCPECYEQRVRPEVERAVGHAIPPPEAYRPNAPDGTAESRRPSHSA